MQATPSILPLAATASKAVIIDCSTSDRPHHTTSCIRSWKQNKYTVPALAAAHMNTINVEPARIHELEAVDAWSAAEIEASLIRCSPFVWTTGKVLHPHDHHHVHPAYKVVKAACDEWLVGVAQPTSDEGADFLTASGIPWLCCMAFPPSTPQERLLRISKLVAWMTLVDDLDDKTSPSSCSNVADDRHTRIMSSLISSQSAAAACGELNGRDDRLLLALSELWHEMTNGIPSSLQSRLIAAYKETLDASHAQAVFRKARRLPSTLQEFVTHRRPSSLYPTGIVLLQYALDIELDHATLEHPLIHQLITAVVDYCSWCNDLFSCQVEISHREFFNLPSLLFCSTASSEPAATSGHPSSMYTYASFQDAIDEAVRMVNAADSLCVSLVAEVDKSELMCNTEKPGLRSFIQGLGTWRFAVHKWYAESPRYRKQKKNWTPL